MSWQIFKERILQVSRDPRSIRSISDLARLWAVEYQAAIRRGGDTLHLIPLANGNLTGLEAGIRSALERGLYSSVDYDLVGAMGPAISTYWTGATMSTIPTPVVPAPGSTSNIAVQSNMVTNPGIWGTEMLGSAVLPDMSMADVYSISNAYNAINIAGIGILTDENDVSYDTVVRTTAARLPREVPLSAISNNPISSTVSASNVSAILRDCTALTTYDSNLSSKFKLAHLTTRAVFPHTIRAQRGLTIQQIVCNLQHVCQNILEPISDRYPNMFITSGFRQGDAGTTSWHTTGSAVDIQFRGFSPRDYLPVAEWIIQNIPFNTFIFEHGRSIWFHIDLPKTTTPQRKILTMYRGQYFPGITLYYN
jgi:hypothetical protein